MAIVAAAVVAGIPAFLGGSRVEIGPGVAGVRVRAGSAEIFRSGESVRVIPLLDRFHEISLSPATVSLVGDEGVKTVDAGGNPVTVESQVTYDIRDIERALAVFGYESTHDRIRQRIREAVRSLIREAFAEGVPVSGGDRAVAMAEMHLRLNSELNADGINISGYDIRFK